MSLFFSTCSASPIYQQEQDLSTYTQSILEFSDVNILIVTDAHSWIAQHVHADNTPQLDAGYGEIASTVEHIKANAKAAGKDVWFFNNGDHVEGSGLSDASVYTTGEFFFREVVERKGKKTRKENTSFRAVQDFKRSFQGR